jgi:hypothetical protein
MPRDDVGIHAGLRCGVPGAGGAARQEAGSRGWRGEAPQFAGPRAYQQTSKNSSYNLNSPKSGFSDRLLQTAWP